MSRQERERWLARMVKDQLLHVTISVAYIDMAEDGTLYPNSFTYLLDVDGSRLEEWLAKATDAADSALMSA